MKVEDEPSVSGVTSGQVIYIVDWDLPAEGPPGRRRAFYRHLEKICRESEAEWERSTLSVLKTSDRRLAQSVYLLAAAHGRVNLYRAQLEESHVGHSGQSLRFRPKT